MEKKLLEIAKRIQALSQAGEHYSDNQFDIERYKELSHISAEILAILSDEKISKIKSLFTNETGYLTPKVDIRGVVFKDDKILMVKEKSDGRCALPGGWADIGLTPSEVVNKEVKEESGLEVIAKKILAVFDKKCHPHPPSPYHVYKIFILCEIIGGKIKKGIETSEVNFFEIDHLPKLSTQRNTIFQIKTMFDLKDKPDFPAIFD